MENKKVYLNRKYKFSAAHRLFNKDFSDDQNQAVFKNCSNPTGHGHNFKLIVTIQGTIDKETGMVINLQDLDRLIQLNVLELLDHRYLNHTPTTLQQVVPTSENIVYLIWNILKKKLQDKLYKITLYETSRNYFEYFGR